MQSNFIFSYSSLNKLLFSPKLFYNHYFLNQREEKIESYLVEGKLVHCYILQPEAFNDLFVVSPKVPTDNIKKLLHAMFERVGGGSLGDHPSTILELLEEQNLYQSFTQDEKRLEKVLTDEHQLYYDFIGNRDKSVVDPETMSRCQESANILREHPTVESHIKEVSNSKYEVYNELPLQCENFRDGFGIKGILDRIVINRETNSCEIVDVKTTGKSIQDFPVDSIEYYNYWLQAAIYIHLTNCHFGIPIESIDYSFWVIDKYAQPYNFGVSESTKHEWLKRFDEALEKGMFHFTKFDFTLPYAMLNPEQSVDANGRILI